MLPTQRAHQRQRGCSWALLRPPAGLQSVNERLPPRLHGARCGCPSSGLQQEPPSWPAHQRRRGSSQALPKTPAGLQQPSTCTSLLPCTVHGVASPPAAWSRCFPLSIPTGSGERAAGRFPGPQLACSSPQHAPPFFLAWWMVLLPLQQLAVGAPLSACASATATQQRGTSWDISWLATALRMHFPSSLHGGWCAFPSSSLHQVLPFQLARRQRCGSSKALPGTPASLQRPSA